MTMYEGNIWEVKYTVLVPITGIVPRYAYIAAETFDGACRIAKEHWVDTVESVKLDAARVFIKSS